MAKAKAIQGGIPGPGTSAPVRGKGRKLMHGVPVRELRAPVQLIRSTKQWLDQIIAEKHFRTYDEAILFLIAERQKQLPSGFGKFPDMPDYTCGGED